MGFFSAKFENEYTLGKRICNGVTSQIRECRGIKDEKDYVVKIYPSELEEVNAIRYEYHLFVKNKINQAPNILKLKDCFFDKYYVYYVMERYEGKDLFSSVMDGLKYSERDLANYFKQLFTALNSLHSMNIVHRNISGKNLVFSDSQHRVLLLKGLRYMLSTNEYSKFNVVVEHSLQYLSPEIIAQETNLLNVVKSDIWACGVILYTLLFGSNLFPIEFRFENYTQNIVRGEINWGLRSPLLDHSNRQAVDFCKSLLKLNPDERMTAKEALSHPWLSGKLSSKNGGSGERVHPHNTHLASDGFYSQVRNSIDELDTLEENTFIQYRHKLNDEVPFKTVTPVKVSKFGSVVTMAPKTARSVSSTPEAGTFTKCLPIRFRRPSFRLAMLRSRRRDRAPLMDNPVVDKYIKDDKLD